jgi:hypothetical protein
MRTLPTPGLIVGRLDKSRLHSEGKLQDPVVNLSATGLIDASGEDQMTFIEAGGRNPRVTRPYRPGVRVVRATVLLPSVGMVRNHAYSPIERGKR